MVQSIASVLCVLANLPGPPIYHWQNFSLSLWPVDREKCPEIDPHRDVLFNLYTRRNPDQPQLIFSDNDSSITNSNMEFTVPTILFSHGFTESHLSDDAQQIKNAYLRRGDFNVILMDSERLLAGPEYIHAAKNTRPIGKYTAHFVDYLISLGLDLDTLHVIGMSLGAQIAGYIGRFVTKGKLRRITGLDPAGPLFQLRPPSERLDPSDAIFVDAIHSNAGINGILYSVGHLDFWPNGGSKQPGCKPNEVIERVGISVSNLLFCHHYRAYQLFVLSINNPYQFPSVLCKNYFKYKTGLCQGTNRTSYLGIAATPRDENGDYYISTGLIGVDV